MRIVWKDNARKPSSSSSSILHVALYEKQEAEKYTSSSTNDDDADADDTITINEKIVRDGLARVSKKYDHSHYY